MEKENTERTYKTKLLIMKMEGQLIYNFPEIEYKISG